ncbi:GNAT family N-acetyltransferase [Gracilibacillus oryzae]|uniref:GNAT family N-acetyltransferase n=1 Tax=Gracilibacillus oryzae TaxID=1672701 RepID=A0A7C8KWE4_9BACI|nr:GNAT family N-acetyltransferase [Gracilibacillus oryzae]KAB8125978.1 GNAT family N-acetyltransferase [Gracilibacillus oryzae]
MRIRLANLSDVPRIVTVHVHSLKASHADFLPADFLSGLDGNYSTARFRKALNLPENKEKIYVAEEEGAGIIGFVWGGLARKQNSNDSGEIYAIYILEEYQGKGIGKKLVQTLAAGFSTMKINTIMVDVLADNLPSCQFYEALGGVKIGEGSFEVAGVRLKDITYAISIM